MIYLDTSAALAHVLGEEVSLPEAVWLRPLVSSRLLEYEMWNRVHAYGLSRSHGDVVRSLIDRVALVELAPPVLTRALEPFPTRVRTLDGLHLATMTFLMDRRQEFELASFDGGLRAAAGALGVPILAAG